MPSTMLPVSGSVDNIEAFIQGVSVNTLSRAMSGMSPKIFAGSGFKKVISGSYYEDNGSFNDSLVTPMLRMIDPFSNNKGFTDINGNWQAVETTSPLTDAGSSLTLSPNHETEKRDFGQTKHFKDGIPYEDMKKYNPVDFLLDDNATLMYPLILWNASMKDPDQYDGVIEPLTIRSRASRQNPESPFFAHDIRGLLISDSSECSRLNSIPIVQYIDLEDTSFDWFEDGIENFGGKLLYSNGEEKTGPMHPGYLTQNESTINPFVEMTDWEEVNAVVNVSEVTTAEDPGNMALALLDMAKSEFNKSDGTLGYTNANSRNDRLPRHHKSSGAGFTYNNNVQGTDSLAFGGLLK